MLVSEILATVRPAYCDSWDGVFEMFKNDPHEWRRIEELMAEIKAGALREPGRIDVREPDEDDPEDNETYQYLGNGTHRFAAFVELGMEDFPVEYEDRSAPITDSYTMTEVALYIKKEFLSQDRYEDPIMDCFCSSLSFKVNDEVWAEMGGAFSTGSGVGVKFELSFHELPVEVLPEFARKFLARIACCVKPEMIDSMEVGNITHYEPVFWGGNED